MVPLSPEVNPRVDPAAPGPAPPRRRRRVRRWLVGLVGLTALWLLASLIAVHQLTRRGRPRFAEPVPVVSWAHFEPVRLPTRDGHVLGAWYAEGPEAGPSVVMLHGNGRHRGDSLYRAELFAGLGCSVLPITHRAHGDSTGDYNDIGYSARLDVIAAVEFLERKRPGRPILIQGASLGAAAATFASAELGGRIRGYLLEAPYSDLKAAVRNRTGDLLPIGLEWLIYRGLVATAPLVLPDLDKIAPREAIAGVPADVPVWIMAGRGDTKATIEQVDKVLDPVRDHGRLVVFERGKHLGFLQADLALYRSTVVEFLREAAGPRLNSARSPPRR